MFVKTVFTWLVECMIIIKLSLLNGRLCVWVCRSGRFTVRREHNSKLIVTMPSGVQTSDNTDGECYKKEYYYCCVYCVCMQ